MAVAAPRGVHVDENEIIAFVDGGLSAQERSHFREHLDSCPECVALVAGVVKHRSPAVVSTLRPEDLAARAPDRTFLPEGAHVGPYVIERLVGVGGMGVVYAAHDPRLDRQVALKLIRHETDGARRDDYVERLRRESKALARLSHPNVTVVYDLGTADDEIYVAMEYVAGTNLRAWLLDARRGVREIVATFTRAGRGLAAAHAAGLVHRDFKPDNVLLGSDGSVKVTDFGLARLDDDGTAIPAPVQAFAEGSNQHAITRTGALVGTPAYMAPEQFVGGTIDGRADQFAFCVALYEALYGERPFRGDTIEQLRNAVLAGRVVPARGNRVSARIRRALVRGLSASPDERFPSMDALVSALAPRRGRLAFAIGGLAVVTAGSVALAATTWLAQPAAQEPCKGASAEVEQTWNTARRDAIRQAFVATGVTGADKTWSDVERRIDRYLGGWAAMHGETCEATHVHHQQSEAVLDLRMTCLERRRAEVDALLGVLGRPDADVVHHAREAVDRLESTTRCADVEALGRRVALPRDPVQRGHYEALRRRLDLAVALVDVARLEPALASLTQIATEAAAAELPALEAEAQQARGKVLTEAGKNEDAEQALFRALVRAQAARADDLVAMTAIDLAHVTGYRLQRTADGLRWADFAAAAIAAKGGDDSMLIRLDNVRGTIYERASKLAEAEQAQRRALELAERKAPDTTLHAEVLGALGSNLGMQGKLGDAVVMLEKALAIRERIFGTVHLLTASTRMNLANALGTMQRYDEALAQFKQALAAQEALLGADGFNVSTTLGNMGQMLVDKGDFDAARPLLERALRIREQTRGPDDPSVARTLADLGYLAVDSNDLRTGLERFTRADAIYVKALGADHPARLDTIEGIGLAHLGLHEYPAAIEALERARALRLANPMDPVSLASLESRLARALWESGRDKPRARGLATAARKILAEAGQADEVAQIDAMLRR
ncbi:MAG TPA: tetratricopeptide repeat protein [Kofleriaceae bacterium]|nr:tetratricopeptide repeat protein [Kofleriaceae bacterium]